MSTSDTPIANNAAVWARVVDQADQGPPHEQMVPLEDVRELERAANEMRDSARSLNEARDHHFVYQCAENAQVVRKCRVRFADALAQLDSLKKK